MFGTPGTHGLVAEDENTRAKTSIFSMIYNPKIRRWADMNIFLPYLRTMSRTILNIFRMGVLLLSKRIKP